MLKKVKKKYSSLILIRCRVFVFLSINANTLGFVKSRHVEEIKALEFPTCRYIQRACSGCRICVPTFLSCVYFKFSLGHFFDRSEAWRRTWYYFKKATCRVEREKESVHVSVSIHIHLYFYDTYKVKSPLLVN